LHEESNLTLGITAKLKVLRMGKPIVTEERLMEPWLLQLDYKRNDIHESPAATLSKPLNASTKGRQLVEALFSHPALAYKDDIDIRVHGGRNDRDVSYMRQVLHGLGEKYGFVDLTSNFFIEWDATLATDYNEDQYRLRHLCNTKPDPKQWQKYSGLQGDPLSYVEWSQFSWSKGKPICSNEQECSRAPKTLPAEILRDFYQIDPTVGCLRLRVGFKGCTDFNLGQCYKSKGNEEYNRLVSRQDKHTGSSVPHENLTDWCDAYYPEEWGPTNYNKDKTRKAKYRYRYRLSPCILCRQAQEVCNALKKGKHFEDGHATRRDNGDLDYVAEIPLGCFGMEHSPPVIDTCCDNACDPSCASSLEACVRSRQNPVCANPNHKASGLHDTCEGTALCTPRNFDSMI
jgi:hypothetical protein